MPAVREASRPSRRAMQELRNRVRLDSKSAGDSKAKPPSENPSVQLHHHILQLREIHRFHHESGGTNSAS